ncbi:RAB11-binding protein RELCH homolog isoform X1 [Macrobrachium rosenbergii]|uniref:RAB11-binding protein RELCH homolog isoform X1 n=1 Tax=Macrobrachium rosenbergii TaxID=79674 RepID=UPI0034D75AFC
MAEAESAQKDNSKELSPPPLEIKKRERPSPAQPWDEIAAKLLHEKLLLTALELHTELTEAGCELPRLRDYFSNPANFEQYASKSFSELHSGGLHGNSLLPRSSSQTTLDSLDWGHLSEDGERAVDERVAVLEFELRKARETIQGLRANLTQATEAKPISSEKEEADEKVFVAALSSIRPHEKRTLNFLINEYLVTNSYKLTAITFADENDDQDFEHWDDVGLNISRPPNLVQMLRECGHNIAQHTSCACQTDDVRSQEEENELNLQLLEKELEELKQAYAAQERELKKLKRKSSTPRVTPLQSPQKQIENARYSDEKLNPVIIDGVGRESPEGTSDNEETSGGGGFVMVAASSASIPSTRGSLSQVTELADIRNIESTQDESHSDILESEVAPLSRYGDPADSIEDLIQTSTENTQDDINERLCEAIDSKDTSEKEAENSQSESLQETLSVTDMIPPADEGQEISPKEDYYVSQTPDLQEIEKSTDEYLAQLRLEAKKLLRVSTKRQPPEAYEEHLLQATLTHTMHKKSRVQAEVATLGQGGKDLLDVVASSLHNIAPNVILAKREELLPLLIYGVSLHKDSKERERLLHLLFNLIKRPDEDQRNAILTGLVGLARVLGSTKLEEELLPQCWEQLTHKYVERRLLVAQSTAALSPYTPASLRNSLLLSMLLQLLGPGGEKEMIVREAALASLSLLITYLDDDAKIPVLVETLLYCLENLSVNSDVSLSSVEVSYMTKSPSCSLGTDLYISSLAVWTVETNSLNILLNPLLVKLSQQASHIQQIISESQNSQGHMHHSVVVLIEAIIKTIPYIVANLINTMPSVEDQDYHVSVLPVTVSALHELETIYGCKSKAEKGLLKLYQYLSKEWFKSWDEFEYITKSFIPDLIDVLCLLDASAELVIQSFIKLFTKLNMCLGPHVVVSSIAPIFLKHLSVEDDNLELVREGKTGLTGSLVVVYTVAILASSCGGAERQAELEGFLARQISILALCRARLDSLYVTVSNLLLTPRNQESVLGALWSCVVHESSMVRKCSAGLWAVVVTGVEDAALGTRVVPALVTLATDPDISVKASALQPLAVVITTSTNTEVLDKVWLQLETLCDDPYVTDNLDFQLAIARTCTALAHTSHPRLIHQFLLPRMCRLAIDGRHSEEEWLVLGLCLLEAYSALTCCQLPDHVIAHFVVPPLNQLQKTMGSASFEHMETITDLIKEYSLRTQSSQGFERRKTGALPVHPGVDDMKNKMSKMFASRPTTNVLQAKAQAINVSLPGFLKKNTEP